MHPHLRPLLSLVVALAPLARFLPMDMHVGGVDRRLWVRALEVPRLQPHGARALEHDAPRVLSEHLSPAADSSALDPHALLEGHHAAGRGVDLLPAAEDELLHVTPRHRGHPPAAREAQREEM